jgi:MATE family multidrug resistance protein
MAAIGAAIWLLRDNIAMLYTSEPDLLLILPGLFAIIALLLIPDGGQVVMTFALRGAGEAWAPTVLHLLAFIVVMIPAAWLLAFPLGFGVVGLVISIALGAGAALLALSLRFWMVSRRP